MLMDMKTLTSGIDFMAQTYSQEELKLIRRKEKPTPQMLQKMIQNICVLAQLFSSDHPSVERVQRGPHIRNTFLFRYALCGYISILKRIENGTAKNIKPEKLRNDVVDINVIAAATYFDGLLTTDDKARTIYADAEFFLRELFPMPPWRVRIVIALVQGIRAVRGFFARRS